MDLVSGLPSTVVVVNIIAKVATTRSRGISGQARTEPLIR